MLKIWKYIKKRLNERSTWMLFTAGVASAAALVWPWSLVFAILSVVAAFVPDGEMSNVSTKPTE